jgi:hypothetical protein
MNLNFDIENVKTTEFGVGRYIGSDRTYAAIPVHLGVQTTLQEMVANTCRKMEANAESPSTFDPAEKYASVEYLTLPIDDDLALRLKTLHETPNLTIASADYLDWMTRCFCYFARLWDVDGKQLTALRRATQFKGALKKQILILALGTDVLRIVDEPIFQLNVDFDVIVDSDTVHIIHPNSFKLLGQIEEAIAEAVPRNIQAIQSQMRYMEWSTIEEYANTHSRAANLLASIRTNGYGDNLDRSALESDCEAGGISFRDVAGQLVVTDGQIMDFLEVVDRRRYVSRLVPGVTERYKASSRTRVGGSGT